MCGIKDVFLEGSVVKVGFVSNLRVHDVVQRGGLGTKLCTELEARCMALGCFRLVLTVNGDNARAKKLFRKLGYVPASQRRMRPVLLTSVRPPTRFQEVPVEELRGADAAAQLNRALGRKDMALADFAELVNAEFFLGAYVMRLGESAAGCSLWDASQLKRFRVTGRLVELGQSPAARPAALGALGGAALAWAWRILQLAARGDSPLLLALHLAATAAAAAA
eukprot:CAMPEP_0172163696 /NCGR_PEP_ID=MMETSP1050-20130122/7416_1 /TAXON_ID=233186 /ORGANISM="Cryptomonas curvata, Strain CCAP979/52" /LENGTH=221 /DNA_ID=CAMNT_0012833917 /DNA_START=304 /DNA_END=966 /DNA_ORIENTATION=+